VRTAVQLAADVTAFEADRSRAAAGSLKLAGEENVSLDGHVPGVQGGAAAFGRAGARVGQSTADMTACEADRAVSP
jgi:hypothetical protein